MKVDVLDALLATAVLFGVGKYLFWVNKTLITLTADAVFGIFQEKGARDERIRRYVEERMKEDEEDQKKCSDFQPPPVQVIDDVGKK